MHTLSQIGLIVILGALVSLFLPWWSFVLVAFGVCFFLAKGTGSAFLAGFLGLFVLWGGYAFWLNQSNDGILAEKMGLLFGGLSPILMILVTAGLGAILGGLASWSGFWVKSALEAKN